MAVTLKDISRQTKVGVGTISQVLNKHPKADAVREDTRNRIFAAAHKLGYSRNELAATTRTGINRTIALVGDFHKSLVYVNSVISGVLMTATENDYGIRVYFPAKLDACMDEIRSQRIKYVIVESLDAECRKRMAEFCKKNHLQLTYIFEQSCDGLPTVATTDRLAMKDAVARLVALGHRRIALLCSGHTHHYKVERHQGYLEGLAAAGIVPNEQWISCSIEMRESELAADAMLRLPSPQRPTAFVCIADSLALQVGKCALEYGFSIPEEISIIGFGDDDICATFQLTSIAQPFEEMGKVALEIALGKKCSIKPNEKNEYLLPTKYIERKSAAKCKEKTEPRKKNRG